VLEHIPLPLRWEVLVKRPAEGHVQDLHAAADPEYRHPTSEGQPDKRHLESVPLRDGGAEFPYGLLTIITGVQIAPTTQQ
jgi:hypothetical protein